MFTFINMIIFLDWLQGQCFGLDVIIFLKKSPHCNNHKLLGITDGYNNRKGNCK